MSTDPTIPDSYRLAAALAERDAAVELARRHKAAFDELAVKYEECAQMTIGVCDRNDELRRERDKARSGAESTTILGALGLLLVTIVVLALASGGATP